MTEGLTPYISPAMLLSSALGISWKTFPRPGASDPEVIASLLDICWALTSDMDTIANMTLRATQDTETELGPDFIITLKSNGWARFRMTTWPILYLVSGEVSPASSNPPTWNPIPASALIPEHSGLPHTGSLVPSVSPGPTAAMIAPGYVDFNNGRNGYLVSITTLSGWPVCGIDVAASAGASTIHVDDIAGWYLSGTGGSRGVIYDPPLREVVTPNGVTPDVTGAITGPGTLSLSNPLQFTHTPNVGGIAQADQRILLSAMPPALIQAGYYFGNHYGLMRGATAAVMQSARGGAAPSSLKAANDWYEMGVKQVSRFARVP